MRIESSILKRFEWTPHGRRNRAEGVEMVWPLYKNAAYYTTLWFIVWLPVDENNTEDVLKMVWPFYKNEIYYDFFERMVWSLYTNEKH